MSRAALLRQRPVLLLLGFLLLAGGWEVYGQISAQSRLTPAVQDALRSGQPLDIVVSVPFQPEQFHIRLLQLYGTLTSVQPDRVVLRRVQPDRLRELAKSYWISRIDLERG